MGGSSVFFPVVSDAVAGESAGVMACSQIDVADVSLQIVKAMRMDHAGCQVRKVVIEGLDRFLGVEMSVAIEISDEFLFLGVHAEDRVWRVFVRVSQLSDLEELLVSLRMAFGGQFFLGLASAEMMPPEQLRHRCASDSEAALDEFASQGTQREIGPKYADPHRIACRVIANDIEKGVVEAWKDTRQPAPTAPFFRERRGGRREGWESSRIPRRIVFSSQPRTWAR